MLKKLSIEELINPTGKTIPFISKNEGAEQLLLNAMRANKYYAEYYKYNNFPQIMRIAAIVGKNYNIGSIEFARNVYLYQTSVLGKSKMDADGQFDLPLIDKVAELNNIDISSVLAAWKNMLGKNWIGNRWAGRRLESQQKANVFVWPVKSGQIIGDYTGNIPSDKNHPTGHFGIDIKGPKGTPIFPIAPGIVIGAGDFGKGGNGVKIDHGNGITSYYAHMDSLNIKNGDKVTSNNIIGTMGASGNARGSVHLHFEVKVNGNNINPKNIIGKSIKV